MHLHSEMHALLWHGTYLKKIRLGQVTAKLEKLTKICHYL